MNDDPTRGSAAPARRVPARREREAGRSLPPGEAAQTGGRTGERIAKRLARAGIASRRDAEGLIAAGRVKVNGRVLASPAFNVEPADVIELDGEAIPPIERTRLFLFHKPAGVVTTNRDPEGRRTVFDTLPKELPRLMTIGRLDINTEGLLLLTNDGGLAARARTAGHRLAAPLPRARSWQGRRAGAGRPEGRHRRRWRVLWRHRGRRSTASQGTQCLADDRLARRQEPRGQEHPGRARARCDTADPRFLRPVPARRAGRGRGAGDQGPHACATSSASA